MSFEFYTKEETELNLAILIPYHCKIVLYKKNNYGNWGWEDAHIAEKASVLNGWLKINFHQAKKIFECLMENKSFLYGTTSVVHYMKDAEIEEEKAKRKEEEVKKQQMKIKEEEDKKAEGTVTTIILYETIVGKILDMGEYCCGDDVPRNKSEILSLFEEQDDPKTNWKNIYNALRKDYAWFESVGDGEGFDLEGYKMMTEEEGEEFKEAFKEALNSYPSFEKFMEEE